MQKRPTAELSLKVGNQLLQKIHPSQKHFRQVLEVHPTPEHFMAWIAANCSVSYYEPLSLWTLTLADHPTKTLESSPFVDEWKPKTYQTSFMMTAKGGQEIGVATLDYTPPHSKTITQVAELDFDFDEEDGGPPEVSIETKK